MAVPAPWTDDEISKARSMWNAGKTAAEIASEMGRTRNSVIGIAHRQKFPPRAVRPKQPKKSSSDRAPSSRRVRKAGAVEQPITPAAPAPFLTATGCQWPVQSGPIEPGQHMTMLVCDNPIEPRGTSRRYCKFHAEYQHVKQNGEALEYA